MGVELIAELHRAAEENIRGYHSATQRCVQIETMLADAHDFGFPNDPLVLYLFNPLPERAVSEVLQGLEWSLAQALRPVWIVYHNPLLETSLGASAFLEKAGGTSQYSVYRTTRGANASTVWAQIQT